MSNVSATSGRYGPIKGTGGRPTASRHHDSLEAEPALFVELPEGTWHPLTKRWWANVWSSPMAAHFIDVDIDALFRLAYLVERFYGEGKTDLASEIRLQEARFGLTPGDRKRLGLEVSAPIKPRPTPPARVDTGEDPLAALN